MDRILHYDIASILGEGKNGPSYLAYDSGLQRPVVLKRLVRERHTSEAWWSNYTEKTAELANLNDPSLAALYGHDTGADGNFIIREYIEGESFAEIAARGNIEPRRIHKLALGVAEAIRAAHESGLIHGNISSHNLLVTDSQQVVLCDFALDAPVSDEESGQRPVSDFVWLAPEQLGGEKATAQSDLYSVGLVLKHLVTNKPPPEADSIETLTRRRLLDSDPGTSASDTPAMIHLLLGRLLAGRPSDRLATAAELCSTIQEILVFGEGEPSRATQSERRFSPRQYLLITVLAILLVIFWLVITSDPG